MNYLKPLLERVTDYFIYMDLTPAAQFMDSGTVTMTGCFILIYVLAHV